MRNFIPTRNNMYRLPHNTYMQILYILRDYERYKKEKGNRVLSFIAESISEVSLIMTEDYAKRDTVYGKLDSYRAFFNYAYYSYMFARKNSELGASKSAWSLYKSKYAYLLAEKLNLI